MDRIALVTGSTNNVGKGIAEVLSEDGFLVIVTSRHGNEAREDEGLDRHPHHRHLQL